jgi:hypothetical protein
MNLPARRRGPAVVSRATARTPEPLRMLAIPAVLPLCTLAYPRDTVVSATAGAQV